MRTLRVPLTALALLCAALPAPSAPANAATLTVDVALDRTTYTWFGDAVVSAEVTLLGIDRRRVDRLDPASWPRAAEAPCGTRAMRRAASISCA